MRRLTTFAELARLADITRQAVSDAARTTLQPAVVGRRIDAGHPVVREYLERHGVTATAIDAFTRSVDPQRGPGVESEDDDFEIYADLTFRELFERFGTFERFAAHLDAYKVYEQVIGQRLKNEELSGKLIDRSFVQTFVFGVLEELSQRLLRDHPKTTARQAFELFTAGGSAEEVERIIRTDVSSHLVPTQRRIEASLRKKAAEAAQRARSGAGGDGEPPEETPKKKRAAAAKKAPVKSARTPGPKKKPSAGSRKRT